MEKILGEAGFEQNLRVQTDGYRDPDGNSGSNLDIQFIRPVRIFSLGFAVTDLDVDDVIIRASLKGKQISKEVINGWFRGVFDSSEGDAHVPSWDKLNNAVVAERDGDGFLSEEKFQGCRALNHQVLGLFQMFNSINYLLSIGTVCPALRVITCI